MSSDLIYTTADDYLQLERRCKDGFYMGALVGMRSVLTFQGLSAEAGYVQGLLQQLAVEKPVL